MAGRSTRTLVVLVFLVAARLGWAAWEFVFRHYGPGRTTGALLLEASPAAAAVAWLATTAVVAAVGLLLVRVLRGTLG